MSSLLRLPLLGILLTVSVSTGADSQQGKPIHFRAELSAGEQSAVTHSSGTGRAEFVLERETLRFSWVLTYNGLTSKATGVGVHGPQTPGGNAGLLIDMGDNGLSSPIKGSVQLSEGELEYLLTGRMYVNLRTTEYELGELRGQIMRLRPSEVQ